MPDSLCSLGNHVFMHRHCMIEEQLFNPKWLFSPFFSWVSAVAVIWLLFLFVPDLLSALLCFLEESISYGAMPRPLVCNLLRMYPCLWTPLYMEEFFPALAAAGNLHCSISQEGKYCFTIIKANKCLQMGQLVLSCVSIKCDTYFHLQVSVSSATFCILGVLFNTIIWS